MSAHKLNRINSQSILYLQNLIGERPKCLRKQCQGYMVEVLTRYRNFGPINHEYECPICGKVKKDPAFAEERKQYWKNKQKKYYRRQNVCKSE